MLGASSMDLLEVYMKQVRSILELTVPAWHPGITVSFNIIQICPQRRVLLCKKKLVRMHTKHTNWFKRNTRETITRQKQPQYCQCITRTRRFERSPICYLTSLLNKYSEQISTEYLYYIYIPLLLITHPELYQIWLKNYFWAFKSHS